MYLHNTTVYIYICICISLLLLLLDIVGVHEIPFQAPPVMRRPASAGPQAEEPPGVAAVAANGRSARAKQSSMPPRFGGHIGKIPVGLGKSLPQAEASSSQP